MKAWKSGCREVNGRFTRVIKKYSKNSKTSAAAGIPTFLTDETQYNRIRQLWLNHRVIPICGDLTGNKSMIDIAKALRDSGLKLTILYPSNAEHYFEEMDVHPRRVDYLTKNMSGGNQQKVILARWMSTDVDVVIFDEPTKGVDVAAKAEIYRLMEELVEEGKSIIVVSSELPEAVGISDRIIVMSEGKVTAELTNKVDFKTDAILDYAIGGN